MSEPCWFCHTDHSAPDHGCPCVGVKAGGGDDAIHIVDHVGAVETLCGGDAASRNTMPLEGSSSLNGFDGCWTCLIKRDERPVAA